MESSSFPSLPPYLTFFFFFLKKKVNFEEQENLPEPSEATRAVGRADLGLSVAVHPPSGGHTAAPQMPQQRRCHRRSAPLRLPSEAVASCKLGRGHIRLAVSSETETLS